MAGWLGVVSIGAVLLLRGAEGADDKRLPPVDSEMRALSQKVAALEARLRVLEAAVQVSGSNVKLVSSQSLTLQAGMNIAMQSGTGIAINSSNTIGISGAGAVDIRGAMVMLGPGGRPVARVGDPVACGNMPGTITGGSSTVLAQ
jgi:hypothetical protein